MNPTASDIFKTRHEYRKTDRYKSVEFLEKQISETGLPSENFKLKQSLLSKSVVEYPDEWTEIMENITEKWQKATTCFMEWNYSKQVSLTNASSYFGAKIYLIGEFNDNLIHWGKQND